LQGVAALREELLKIMQNPEATRTIAVGRNRQSGGAFTPEAQELQDRAAQIRARIGDSQRAIAAAEVQAARTIALQSARGYTDLGQLFLSEVRKRFDEGVDKQMKENATTVETQLKDAARTTAARDAARNKFGSVLKSIIGGTLDAVGDAVGGKQGAEKYLRENGQFGLAFRLFNKIAAIGGSGTPTKLAEAEALNPLLASRGVTANDQRYVTGISNPDDALTRAQIESARLLKEQAGIQKESRDLLRQIGQYLKDGGTVAGFGL